MRCVLLIACSSTALEFTVPARDGYKLSVITSKTTKTDDAVLLLHGRTWSSGPVWQTTGAIDALGPGRLRPGLPRVWTNTNARRRRLVEALDLRQRRV